LPLQELFAGKGCMHGITELHTIKDAKDADTPHLLRVASVFIKHVGSVEFSFQTYPPQWSLSCKGLVVCAAAARQLHLHLLPVQMCQCFCRMTCMNVLT